MLLLRTLFLSFIVVQTVLSSTAFADKELRVSVVNYPPYYIYQGEFGVTGIVTDVLLEITKRLGVEFTMVKLPQKRMLLKFRTGELDIEPATNPIWRSEDKNISLYTIPYLKIQQVIAVNKSAKISDNILQDFTGKTIGTILGYNYDKTLGDAFNKKLIIRQDAIRHDKNLILLKAGRIDGILIGRKELKYWINKLDYDSGNYKEAYDIGPSNDVSMRLHISQSELLPKINQTLGEMLKEGFVDRAIIKYTSKSEGQRITKNNQNDLIYDY